MGGSSPWAAIWRNCARNWAARRSSIFRRLRPGRRAWHWRVLVAGSAPLPAIAGTARAAVRVGKRVAQVVRAHRHAIQERVGQHADQVACRFRKLRRRKDRRLPRSTKN